MKTTVLLTSLLFFTVVLNCTNSIDQDWSIKINSSILKESESIGNNPNEIMITPNSGELIAKIELEVIALKGEIGRLRERLAPDESFINSNVVDYLSGKMPEVAKSDLWGVLHKPADVSNIKTQLFLSKNVKLIIDKSEIIPQFAQIEGYGTTMTDNGQFYFPGEDYNPEKHFVVFFMRNNMLAAWFRPEKKVRLTLYYSVPKNIDNAKLQFYNIKYYEINF